MATSLLECDEVLQTFGIDSLTDNQQNVLTQLLDKKDVFLSIKTGGGKSLCYQAFPTVFRKQHPDMECKVLVISPLISIMKEQSAFLCELGLTASYIGKSRDDDAAIMDGRFQFVFASPESVVGKAHTVIQ
jgi:ATP-dependent DNA helicase RecQ